MKLAAKIVGAILLVVVGLLEWEHVNHTRTELAYLAEQVTQIRAAVEKNGH